MLGTTMSSPPRHRRQFARTVVGLAFVAGSVLGLGACRAKTEQTQAPVPSVTSTTTTPGVTAGVAATAGPNEAWCAKLDALPDVVGSAASLKLDQLDKLLVPFKELRQLSPAEAKADFDTIIDFLEKASARATSGPVGTSQEEMAKWAAETFGTDGIAKFKAALDHIVVVQTSTC